MAILVVDNVPDDLYEALRARADRNRTSIATEVMALLEQFVPTDAELQRRRESYERLAELRANPPLTAGPFPSAEEMIREDRER